MAHAVEERLLAMGCRAFVLDGDNVRRGLCGDLGFSLEDRAEHIGRSLKWSSFSLGLGVIVLTLFNLSIGRELTAGERHDCSERKCRNLLRWPAGNLRKAGCEGPLPEGSGWLIGFCGATFCLGACCATLFAYYEFYSWNHSCCLLS